MPPTEDPIVTQFRENTYKNETFLIGILQVVAGGALFGALSQWAAFEQRLSARYFPWFLLLCAAALVFAILAAYFKHEYLRYGLKSQIRAGIATEAGLFALYDKRSSRFLDWMRGMFHAATAALVAAFVGLGIAVLARLCG